VLRGGNPKPGDSDFDLLRRWLLAEGGLPQASDSSNWLLQRLVVARGGEVSPGASDADLYRKLAGTPPNTSSWDSLRIFLTNLEA
jgi:hypothetical protein